MDGFGSYGGGDRRMEIVSGKGLGACHQAYSPTQHPPPPQTIPARESWSGHRGAAAAAAAAAKPWGFTDPEVKRKKRIARYKAYTVEGRVKASLRRGFQWVKNKCSQIVHGY
ncbi:uncharacterized protein LOC115750200 [Rhodamnia argentea]|uniref:Uncharacterized protein LOC115750200 n=1 Tax=Rhodamnia argentea TaxID=178133 RepID=A0ABM3GXC3_9MYRT|nr:uncharacterized protein LOC115750200 [Rhodamnia argentea]